MSSGASIPGWRATGFRDRFRRVVVWSGLVIAAVGGGQPRATAETFPATAGERVVTIGGVNRVEAAPFLSRYGLEEKWLEAGRKARFASAWTALELDSDKREVTLNGSRLFLGDPVVAQKGRLWLSRIDAEALIGPLLRSATYAAKRREPRIIVIDAGHGGRDTGTRNAQQKLDEKALTLDVARRLADLLKREGYQVVQSRDDDTYVGLEERATKAAQAKADLFVSIHFNAVEPGSAVHGTETYVLTPRYQRSTSSAELDSGDRVNQPGNAWDAWNAILGYQIHRALLDELKTFDRGLKRARFAVLRLAPCPAVLVEAGYVSNDAEARRIGSSSYRQRIAEALATGIARYAAQVDAAVKR